MYEILIAGAKVLMIIVTNLHKTYTNVKILIKRWQSGGSNSEYRTFINGRSCICHIENQNIRNDRYLIRVSFYF